ncbi:MAG: L-fucose/L-arabinose isomerase family protein [Tannerella sp.]|jgi:L-arabinose isomerase|nr:L-fucose/L-arabinose isomerase family protein [Tannerella sp.]
MKIGLFGIGLETYWPQFDGLLPRLEGYRQRIKTRIEEMGVTVIDAGMVDNPDKAHQAADFLREEKIDIAFLYISTYALSSTVLPIAQQIKVPVIVLNVQPVAAIDYDKLNAMGDRGNMTGEWLAHCQACAVPEVACVFNRSGIRYDIVSGYLDDQETWTQIKEWIEAANVLCALNNSRLGILGHYYGGMLDVYTDLMELAATFGTHIEMLEMCELKAIRDEISAEEIDRKINEFNTKFDVIPACEQAEIERAAHTSVAMDKLVDTHRIDALAYYYEGYAGNDYANIVTSVIAGNTLLTGKKIPVAGECEVKNVQAMKIMAEFGAGGSFSEFYAMDFTDDVILLGHDGPAHFNMAEDQVKLVPLPVYHGKPGKGLSIQMSVKHGPVTILSVVEDKSGFSLLLAESESVAGPTLQIGNTNSRYKFSISAKEFMEQWSKAGPSHHCAIGIGHISGKIKKLGFLLNIPVKQIC